MAENFVYGEYLASREWALKKEAVRSRSGGRCERCYRGQAQQVHHLTYERIGHEILPDLIDLCRGCHEYLSAKSSEDPRLAPLNPLPLPIKTEPFVDDRWASLLCPVCGFNYVHISDPDVDLRCDGYEHVWVRGGVVRLNFWCENGHKFALEFGFHKGETFVRVAPDCSYQDENTQ